MNPFNRREFIQRGALLSATAAAIGPNLGYTAEDEPVKKQSPNDRLRVAVVGVHGRGMNHVRGFLGKNNCEIVTICDCDEAVVGNAMKQVGKGQKTQPKFEQDIRKVIEDKSIDVVSIATPNHWHALMAIWAMAAGKDVYVEKPASHNIHEGRLMAEAARKFNRICQVGTQSRSNPGMRAAIDYIQSGKLGKCEIAYGTCYKRRPSIGDTGIKQGIQQPPKTMDYNLWTGPAALEMPRRNTKNGPVHYDWHWIWNYGNGDFGNQGVHEADKARWGLNKELPNSVVTVGGRFGYTDDGETPNTELALYDYGDAQMIFEVRGLETGDFMGAKVGNIWMCENGYVVCPSYSGGAAFDKDGKKLETFNKGGDQYHFDNFVKAVRSGKPSDLNCEVEQGHYSAALCHLANISYRLGAKVPFTEKIECFSDCEVAGEAFERMKKHLTDNNVDLAETMCMVGPKLEIDAKAEKFTDGQEQTELANAMLTRAYREGFDVNVAIKG